MSHGMTCITQNPLTEFVSISRCYMWPAVCLLPIKNVPKTPSLIVTISIVHPCNFKEWLIEMWFCRLFGLSSFHSRNQKSSMPVPITVALLFKAVLNHSHSPFMSFITLKDILSRFGKWW